MGVGGGVVLVREVNGQHGCANLSVPQCSVFMITSVIHGEGNGNPLQ